MAAVRYGDDRLEPADCAGGMAGVVVACEALLRAYVASGFALLAALICATLLSKASFAASVATSKARISCARSPHLAHVLAKGHFNLAFLKALAIEVTRVTCSLGSGYDYRCGG
eukprot:CAMPEP_0117648216 /NCGR_PEP_ID=MMETSP0804-20121206/274_1 /TAXON_ID=1074897 /ORGANISM="Tetraselmis astigmatica, Strain CCMP880" /LENGTH=113 /DNA_ID=CAMNT_0005453779 /DNA_START=1655 /DNA_END=1996 /DNA_ORIENTATION=-